MTDLGKSVKVAVIYSLLVWVCMGLVSLVIIATNNITLNTNPETWTKSTEVCGMWCPMRDVILPLAILLFVVGLILRWFDG